jgi:hypothetical protein
MGHRNIVHATHRAGQNTGKTLAHRGYAWRKIGSMVGMAFTCGAVGLTTAALAVLGRSRRLAHVLLRSKIELLFALGATEVIHLPFVFGSSSCGSRFYVHTAHRIFHNCCAFHYHLSFVCGCWCDDRSNVDRPASAPHHALPLSRSGITCLARWCR